VVIQSPPVSHAPFISQQPGEIAVANRYLVPAPTVSLEGMPQRASVIVTASLFYHGDDEEVSKTVDGRQDVLQGVKKLSLDSNGKAVFNKLKIVEVSSKHKHQAFCLLFTVEELSSSGKRVLAKLKTTPFHVQSRPNKRKSLFRTFLYLYLFFFILKL
jgi:hypothetical protein